MFFCGAGLGEGLWLGAERGRPTRGKWESHVGLDAGIVHLNWFDISFHFVQLLRTVCASIILRLQNQNLLDFAAASVITTTPSLPATWV